MKVVVSNVNLNAKTCTLQVENKAFICRVVTPSNKGSENDLWVDIRPDNIREALGAGDHKNWLTIPRDESAVSTVETEKKPTYPPFVSILNLMNYVSPEEYETCRVIFDKATKTLNELKAKAGYKVK